MNRAFLNNGCMLLPLDELFVCVKKFKEVGVLSCGFVSVDGVIYK